MRYLLVDDDTQILDLLSIVLENNFNALQIDKCLSPKSAIAKLENEHYDLIICDYEMSPYGTGEDVFDYLETNEIATKFLLFTSVDMSELSDSFSSRLGSMNSKYLQKPAKPKDLREFLYRFLNLEQQLESLESEYLPIRIHNFLRFNHSKCDIFLKLNDDKFVKVINEDTLYEIETIDKYIAKNTTHLFVEKHNYDQFLMAFGKNDFLTYNGKDCDILDYAKQSHRYINALLKSLGMSDFILELSSNTAQNVLKQAAKEKSLSRIIKRLLSSKDYAYDHTYLITCICAQLAAKLKISNQALSRLSFYALIHDMGITKSELTYIHDITPERIKLLGEEDQFEIKHHHQILAKVKYEGDITEDIIQIMNYHHIYNDAYPYQENFQLARLSTTSAVFTAAHFMSDQLYLHDFDESKMREILTIIKLRLDSPNFSKIIDALSTIYLSK